VKLLEVTGRSVPPFSSGLDRWYSAVRVGARSLSALYNTAFLSNYSMYSAFDRRFEHRRFDSFLHHVAGQIHIGEVTLRGF